MLAKFEKVGQTVPDNIKFKILSAILGIITGATNQFEFSLSKKNKLMQKKIARERFSDIVGESHEPYEVGCRANSVCCDCRSNKLVRNLSF